MYEAYNNFGCEHISYVYGKSVELYLPATLPRYILANPGYQKHCDKVCAVLR